MPSSPSEFPRIASRLGLEGMEVADPYVERLLEGFAFLTARVQLKLEAEQPRLIAHLLEAIYPNFLAPVPSMMIARLSVDPTDPNLTRGHTVPRGSTLGSELARGQDTHCEFRTAHSVTLWPIELIEAQWFTYAPDLPMAQLPQAQGMKGGLRIRLRTGGGLPFNQLGLDRLVLHVAAGDDIAFRLHELLLGSTIGSWVSGDVATAAERWSGADSVRAVGFAADEALLPESQRSFSGHRLLQEVAALPQRLLFFEIGDLAARLATVRGDEVELVIFCFRGDAALESLVDAGSLALFCTPAINLFRKRLDRIAIGPGAWEFHVVPDRTRPMDFEVHSLDSVVGHGTGQVAQQDFHPLYATWHNASAQAYYITRREPRLLSPKQKQQGTRSSYVGEEVFISLVDAQHAPYRDELRQLSLSAWVTNRDLPALLPPGTAAGSPVWRLDTQGPVNRVEALRGPTRPVSRQPARRTGLEPGQPSVAEPPVSGGRKPATGGSRAAQVAHALRSARRRGLGTPGRRRACRAGTNVVRRLPFKGPLVFGSGIEIVLELDEMAFQGTSAFLFASVLEQYFARHAAINSFTQLTLRTPQRGEVMRWKPHPGRRDLL